jgi:hypothetical protein
MERGEVNLLWAICHVLNPYKLFSFFELYINFLDLFYILKY